MPWKEGTTSEGWKGRDIQKGMKYVNKVLWSQCEGCNGKHSWEWFDQGALKSKSQDPKTLAHSAISLQVKHIKLLTLDILLAIYLCGCAKPHQSCPTLFDRMDCSLPGSSVHRILQARILSGLPGPSPGNLPEPGIKPTSHYVSSTEGGFFTTSTTQEWCYS